MKKFGSKTVNQRSSSRLPRLDEFFLRDATSFFFSNFPVKWSAKDLWYVFARFGASLGRIADVFVPGKRGK
ncbi:hypothetical protein REPUB_Repub09cG0167100 [Reevesia pubescens]